MSDDDVSWFKEAFTELNGAMQRSFVILDRLDDRLLNVELRLDRVNARLDRVDVRLTNLEIEVRDGFASVDTRLQRLERPI